MAEKRRLKRRRLTCYLRVFDRNTDKIIGHLANITTEGIMLLSEKPLKVNTIFLCWMDLPAKIDDCKQIIFDAKSVWCSKDKNSELYNTGFKLTGIDPKNVELIKKLITDYEDTKS